MTDSVSEKLGKYKIITEVGRGGFAAVYKAVDTTLNRTVALKVLAPHLLWDPTFVQRFQREAEVAANLDHPNIVTIYEVSQIEGVYFIAMQFLQGRTVSQILEAEGPLPVSRVQAIIEQMAFALDYAHARGFVHRDIKPSNVIVADDGRATLTDFGLVKAGEGTKLSTTGVVFGTPEYMSPEQAEGKRLDARSDIYSLGVVLFEMLAGRAPFVADTTPAVMYKHVHEPPPLDELPSDLSQGVVAVVEKALVKDPAGRFQTMTEMAEALRKAVAEAPVPAEVMPPLPPEMVEEAVPFWRKVPLWGWFAVAVGGLVFLAAVGGVLLAGRGPKATSTPAPMPTDTPTPIPPTDTPIPSAPPGMVSVPAGEFIMGSDDDDVDYALQLCNTYYGDCARESFEDEQPQHTVYLDAFYIDKTEVTNAQYRKCVEAGACDPPAESGSCTRDAYYGDSAYDDYPVIYVSWHQAETYCAWAGARLPTEAEWEYAARGPEGRVFPWGNEFDGTRLNYCDANCEFDWADETVDDGYADTAPVGSYPTGASWCGALDMAGNVWEWVADWYDSGYYSQSPDRDPSGPDSGQSRVLRGGSWDNVALDVRSAYRFGSPPDFRSSSVGFRCARGS